MRYGAHLPLIDFDGLGWAPGALPSYVRCAVQVGFRTITANDHLVFSRPWLDGIVALAGVVEASGDAELATTIALPVVRGAAAVAKAAAALDILSGGRLILGVGPGSSPGDYAAAGVPFEQRWRRFDESVRVLRAHLGAGTAGSADAVDTPAAALLPRPLRPPPVWIASWGSDAGLRRVARLGDGWLASAYNTSPSRIVAGRRTLATALRRENRRPEGFPCSLATMWTYVSPDRRACAEHLARLGAMLNRPVDDLAARVLIGHPEQCAALLRSYAEAGVDRVFIWPLADAEDQLTRVMQEVVPLVHRGPAGPG
jgi:alkanesulfonate monooxygenase SsuD/methylene tetrahydromethanopterin reductase-like flavin-dependent oxidoreductase (luciferase family)